MNKSRSKYSMRTTVNTVLYLGFFAKKVEFRCSCHTYKRVTVRVDGYVNLLNIVITSQCISEHHIVYLKYIQ